MKRIIAMVLSIVMVVSLVPAQVFAEEIPEETTLPVQTGKPEETAATSAAEMSEPGETDSTTEPTEAPVEERTLNTQTEASEENEETDNTTAPAEQEEGIIASGTCDYNLTWVLDDSGILTISGSGDMRGYATGSVPWYEYREQILSVVLEEGITSIGGLVFNQCANLTSVTIPETVTKIQVAAFKACSSLMEIQIPESVVELGSSVFQGCSALASVTIPDGITVLNANTFQGCTSLAAVVLPAGLTSLGTAVFSGCTSLNSISIPECVTEIGNSAFYRCSGLTQISIPDGVTSIGDSAFSGCSGLTEIALPEGLSSIGDYVFYQCGALASIALPENLTGIGSHVFSGCSSLTEIDLPAGVTGIGDYVFYQCGALRSIALPENLTGIGSHVFSGCSSLTEIDLPAGLTGIGDYVFYQCSALTSITLPEGLTGIGRSAFSECSSLTEVSLPDSMTCIGSYAFKDCSNLTRINIPAGVSEIPEYAFSRCEALTVMELPEGVTAIGKDAFYCCSNLAEVSISAGVTSIGDYAFYGCSSLTAMELPDSVDTIGKSAFRNCSNLAEVNIPGGVTEIPGEAFYGCSLLTAIELPDGVTNIGAYAFGNCRGLREIVIPKGVVTIGEYAFAWNDLETISFLGGAPEISENAFNYVEATAYYDTNFESWNADTLLNYGGTLTWEGIRCFSGHIPAVIEAVAPTCTEDGLTEGSRCASCGEILLVQETVPAGHTVEVVPAVVPTCTEGGLTEGSVCTACGTTLIAQESLAATGHTEVIREAVLPTCTEDGLTEGRFCSICGEVLAAQETVPAQHTVVTDEAIAATCVRTGLTEGSHCASCGEILQAQDVVDLLPHSYENGSCTVCGELSVHWELTEEGCLVFSGTGDIPDFSSGEETPWYDRRGSITAVSIGDDITSVGSFAFFGCYNLKSVDFGEDVASIGICAFQDCSALQSITLPAGLTEISGSTFYNCTGLKSIAIPGNVSRIDSYAFFGCRSLTNLSFPASARVEANAFQGCDAIWDVTVTAGTGVMCSYDAESCQYLPWHHYPQRNIIIHVADGVTSIGEYAFYDIRNVYRVWLPDGLKVIGSHAFDYTALPTITIPDGVIEIGAEAFARGASMESIVIPDSVKVLGEGAFRESVLESARLSAGLTVIPADAFSGCSALHTVNVPYGVTVIGHGAFEGCGELKDVSLPESLNEIEYDAFHNAGIAHITLPDSLMYIGGSAFRGCSEMRTLTIPKGVRNIASSAFSFCTKIHSVVINSVELTIQPGVFYFCSRLHSVYFCEGPSLWGVGYGEKGVRYYTDKNDSFVNATMHFYNDYVPVDRINIKDKSGVSGKTGTVLNGQTIYVNLNKTRSISLGYETLPKNANNSEVTVYLGDFGNDPPASIKVTAGAATLSNLQPGEATFYVRNMDYGNAADMGYDPYTYATANVHFVFYRPVTSLTISGDHQGSLLLGQQTWLEAAIQPKNASLPGLMWSVENLTGAASITEDGLITALRSGTVIVRVCSVDGSGVMAEKTLTISEYAVDITGPVQVAGGKSITLKAQLKPFNMTNTKILWQLKNPSDSAYVTLNNGKLTAKAVTEKHQVTVVAESADGAAKKAEWTVLVEPQVSEVSILLDGEPVTGGTVAYDLNDPAQRELTFCAVTAPFEAPDGIQWTCSDKNAFASYEISGDTVTVTAPTGKTGTVTLTAVATDGSGKKAVVKLQFARLAQSLEILDPPLQLRGGSKLNLKTSVELDKTLTDRNILWSLSDDSVPYASVSDKGVLTTYAVSEPVTITVTAQLKAAPEKKSEIQIRLVPGVTDVSIRVNGIPTAKGETVYVDMAKPAVTLTGGAQPDSALQEGSWKNSSTSVASLQENDDGSVTVTMQKVGSTTITFTAEDGSKKSTTVKLQAVLPVKSIGLCAPNGETELCSGKTLQMKTDPATAQDGVAPTLKKFSWSVSDPTAATVSASGSVKALPVYENTRITVTAAALDGSGVSESYDLLIKPAGEETLLIRLGEENISGTTRYFDAVFDGSTILPREQLSAWIYNSTTGQLTQADAEFTVSGKNLYLAARENGCAVSPRAYGSGTVTAKCGSLSAKVTYQAVRFVEGITVTTQTGADWVLSGKTLTLKAAVTNSDATVKKFVWSVSDPTAATVSASGVLKAGNVTERKEITVTVSAADGSGVSTDFQVTVYPAATAITIREAATGRVMNNRTVTVTAAAQTSMELAALVYPNGEAGALQEVTWSCTGAGAKIDADGVITFLKKGTVTIKATAADGSKVSASFKIVIL